MTSKVAIVGPSGPALLKALNSVSVGGIDIIDLIGHVKFITIPVIQPINKTHYRNYNHIPPKKALCSRKRKGRRYRGS